MAEVKITKDNFTSEVLKCDIPVLLDFWAEWCGPCRAFSPVLEEIATELPDDILVAKVNIDKDPELAAKFHIMSIPAIFILKDGKPVKNFIGVQPKEKVLQAVLNA